MILLWFYLVMSISNMVAENKKETDKTGVPTFDAKDVVTWLVQKDEDLLDEEEAKSSWFGASWIGSTCKQCIC
jgi:hypothetical protein